MAISEIDSEFFPHIVVSCKDIFCFIYQRVYTNSQG